MVSSPCKLLLHVADIVLGRIPVLVDNTKTPSFSVMESTAELLYLLNFDKDNKFSFKDENEVEQSQCIQWLTFWSGNGAPAMGRK